MRNGQGEMGNGYWPDDCKVQALGDFVDIVMIPRMNSL